MRNNKHNQKAKKLNSVVISLGGSVIVPDKVDYEFLDKFKKVAIKAAKTKKIVIVTGGGKTARNYISALAKERLPMEIQDLVGIMATKLNARLVAGFFNIKEKIPESLNEVIDAVKKRNIVICGAIDEKAGRTSDSNAAEIAVKLNAEFVNITNVNGLYTKDPKKYKDAKFIPEISFDRFLHLVNKIKYHSGQHFVLDKEAALIIKKYRIKTVILHGLKNLLNYFYGKKFVGTVIS